MENVFLSIGKEIMRENKKEKSEEYWFYDERPFIERRAELLRQEIKVREQALNRAPEGTLRVSKYGNTYHYFHRTEAKDTLGVYIKENNKKLAKALAQKAYDKKIVAEAGKELKILDEFLNKTESRAIGNIYDNMHPGKKILINPVYKDQTTFVSAWEAVSYEPGYFMPGEKEHYTVKHERVRSKAEENIANMMAMYGIPYRYEFPLLLDNVERRPDFTCLNVRTRKEFIWEHFGMLDMEDYALKNVDKISRYILNGYIPGDNFIMTFETQNKPLHSGVIKAMIENYLI